MRSSSPVATRSATLASQHRTKPCKVTENLTNFAAPSLPRPCAGSAPPPPAGCWQWATVPAAPTPSEASVPLGEGQPLRSTVPQLRQQRHEHLVHQPASRLRPPASRPRRAGYSPRTASAERASTSTRGRARKRVQHARLAAAGLPALVRRVGALRAYV